VSRWLEDLSAAPPWSPERVRALPGRVRGVLLHKWGVHVKRRFGEMGMQRVREAAGVPTSALPDEPRATIWYPAWHQVALTRAIIDECLEGSCATFAPLLAEDVRRALPFPVKLLIKTVPPRRVLEGMAREFSQAYDLGRMQVHSTSDALTLAFEGAPIFGEPTWRLLQTVGMAALLELAGHSADVEVALDATESFRVTLAL
jgi:hypothetical protein